MKAQTKALVASVVVIALALSSVSGITYSWWSDSENTNITINTGSLDVSTSDYSWKVSTERQTAESIPSSITINYGGTGTSSASVINIPQDCNPSNLDLEIKYKVKFSANINYQYVLDIDMPDSIAKTISVKKSGSEVTIPVEQSGNADKTTELNDVYEVSIKITSLPSNASAIINLTNFITQKAAPSIVDDLSGVTGSATVVLNAPVDDSQTTPVTVTFDNVPSNAGGLTSSITTDSSTQSAKIDMELKDKDGNLISDVGSTSISFTLDGCYSNVMYYNSESSNHTQPTGATFVWYDSAGDVTSDENDAVKTKVTFITTHFSEFVIYGDSFKVSDADGFRAALNAGLDNITVTKDIETNNIEDTVDARLIVKSKTILNLDGKIITPNDMGNNQKNFTALIIDADTVINASEKGGIGTGVNGGYALNIQNGAVLTINGGDYYGGGTSVQVQKGTLVINGGLFHVEPYSDEKYGYKFVINCIDSAYKDGTAKISIAGGKFVNYNPTDSASENPNANFLAEGHVLTSESSGSDRVYTVYDNLNKATSAVKSGEMIALGEGEFSLVGTECSVAATELGGITIVGAGAEKTKLIITDDTQNDTWNGSSINFKRVTLVYHNGDYNGIKHSGTMTYIDCTIDGQPFLYALSETFTNCVFNQTSSEHYNVWTYGAANVTFNSCTFNCAGKSVLIYNEGALSKGSVSFKNCNFQASSPANGKAAIEVDSRFTEYVINISEDTTSTGFDNGSQSGNTLWNVKSQAKSVKIMVGDKIVYSK